MLVSRIRVGVLTNYMEWKLLYLTLPHGLDNIQLRPFGIHYTQASPPCQTDQPNPAPLSPSYSESPAYPDQ